jgi:hypothetical protein
MSKESIGWALFLVCSFFYIASAWVNKDVLALVGGILFCLACLLFMGKK